MIVVDTIPYSLFSLIPSMLLLSTSFVCVHNYCGRCEYGAGSLEAITYLNRIGNVKNRCTICRTYSHVVHMRYVQIFNRLTFAICCVSTICSFPYNNVANIYMTMNIAIVSTTTWNRLLNVVDTKHSDTTSTTVPHRYPI